MEIGLLILAVGFVNSFTAIDDNLARSIGSVQGPQTQQCHMDSSRCKVITAQGHPLQSACNDMSLDTT